jgi:hypothetical protein
LIVCGLEKFKVLKNEESRVRYKDEISNWEISHEEFSKFFEFETGYFTEQQCLEPR